MQIEKLTQGPCVTPRARTAQRYCELFISIAPDLSSDFFFFFFSVRRLSIIPVLDSPRASLDETFDRTAVCLSDIWGIFGYSCERTITNF